jgi:uncharacterized RDD family membrane protein YckC
VNEPDRVRNLQGRRAGFVSRVVSAGITVVATFVVYVALLVGYAFVQFLVTDEKFRLPHPDQPVSATVLPLMLVVLLTFSWSSQGRALGDDAMGLRILALDGRAIGPVRAFLRAVVVVALPIPCLAWILVSRKNAGLHDLLCRTVVVYDWAPRRTHPVASPVVATRSESRQNR